MENPFFSIVVPVYNCEDYIQECIESVVNQTYSSWELLLIDDGSTDNSGKICDEFCVDPRIKVVHQKNSGELNSRWNGILIANGKYTLGLDADDYLDLNCLETIKKVADKVGSDLIFFGLRCFGEQSNELKCSLMAEKEYSRRELLKIVIKESNTSLCNKAIRLDKIKSIKIDKLIKDRVRFNLDYALIIPILCNIDTGYVIDAILYNYRIHKNSISHLCKVQHILDTGLVTEYVVKTLKKASLLDKELRRWVYMTYLGTICIRILDLFAYDKITKVDCEKIRKSKIYINSRKEELLRNINSYGFVELVILKLFRYKQYRMLKLVAKVLRRHELRNNGGNK